MGTIAPLSPLRSLVRTLYICPFSNLHVVYEWYSLVLVFGANFYTSARYLGISCKLTLS